MFDFLIFQLERTREIESPSQPWQGRILTIKLHPQLNTFKV